MTQLDRLLALVRRTGLPTVIPGPEGGEGDCVLLPLEVFERLSGAGQSLEGEIASVSLEASQETPVSPVVRPPLTEPIVSLQDLLRSQMTVEPKTAPSPASPQIESLEDRFAFGLEDIKILPVLKQKMPPNQSTLDEFGQTLA